MGNSCGPVPKDSTATPSPHSSRSLSRQSLDAETLEAGEAGYERLVWCAPASDEGDGTEASTTTSDDEEDGNSAPWNGSQSSNSPRENREDMSAFLNRYLLPMQTVEFDEKPTSLCGRCLRRTRRRFHRLTYRHVAALVMLSSTVPLMHQTNMSGCQQLDCFVKLVNPIVCTTVGVTYLVSNLEVKYGSAYAIVEWWSAVLAPALSAEAWKPATKGMSKESADSALFSYYLLTRGAFVLRVLLCGRLAIARLAVLEGSMRTSLGLGSRRLQDLWSIPAWLNCILSFSLLVLKHKIDWGTGVTSELPKFFYDILWPVAMANALFFLFVLGMVLNGFCDALGRLYQPAKALRGTRLQSESRFAFGEVFLQMLGFSAGAFTSIANAVAHWLMHGGKATKDIMFLLTSVDKLMNVLMFVLLTGLPGVLLASGHHALTQEKAQAKRAHRRSKSRQAGLLDSEENEPDEWQQKVSELKGRGFTLQALLDFWKGLGRQYMPHFDSSAHTTCDVVRQAIIPLSSAKKVSYAELMNNGKPVIPTKMITHSWSNLFRDLVSAVFADSLNEIETTFVSTLLELEPDALEELLEEQGVLQDTVWICAFSVNQHKGLCSSNPGGKTDTVTGKEYSVCHCGLKKHFNSTPPLREDGESIGCEMNKFDDMMSSLALNDDFKQVIAVDWSFNLFSRAWCVAEIARAHFLGMDQRLVLPGPTRLQKHEAKLQSLRVQDMQASRPEDVQQILAKIPDKDKFNHNLWDLLFDPFTGAIAVWRALDCHKRLERCGHLAKWHAIGGHNPSFWEQVALRS